MRVAFDTNILVYAQGLLLGPLDEPKADAAVRLIADLQVSSHELILPAQVVGEFHHVLVSRARLSRDRATSVTLDLLGLFDIWPTHAATLRDALTLAADRRLQTFDAIIFATAADARCDLLLSEDMQDGFSWRGVRVLNPLTGAALPF